jgi:hypothetical protein
MYPEDSIEAYVEAPPLSPDVAKDAGGILKYWEHISVKRPKLAKFALAYLTAPGAYSIAKLYLKISS